MAQRLNPDANPDNALKVYTDNIFCECDGDTCEVALFWRLLQDGTPSETGTINKTGKIEIETTLVADQTIEIYTKSVSGEIITTDAIVAGDFSGDWTIVALPLTTATTAQTLIATLDLADITEGTFLPSIQIETSCGMITANIELVVID